MVEISSSGSDFMLTLFRSRASALVFAFGSCKEGWYYRCLGVDP
ncbi:hypothetical protein BT93_B2412 [Corymbia citriodora subsp. variegata]|nr:hypothetical protein BT93_B2412 [Corymbia citriodora subsp. variegata]